MAQINSGDVKQSAVVILPGMGTRKNLQNIVHGMVRNFASRHNELMGYWYPGFLRAACEREDQMAMSIDLLGQTMWPDGPESYGKLIVLRQDFCRRLEMHGLDLAVVRSAAIDIDFAAEAPPHFFATSWRGAPTSMSMTVVDDRGKRFQSTVFVSCASHDPHVERRGGG
jgi:hypothetical protein